VVSFVVVKDGRTGKPVALLLNQGRQVAFMARGEAADALEILARATRVMVESRQGTSIVKNEIKRGQPGFLRALTYRLAAPLLPMLAGVDKAAHDMAVSGAKLWRTLISDEPPPVVVA
jgi:hypothetical protein